jgi:hypothetical protein
MPPPLAHLFERAFASNEVLAVIVAAVLSLIGWIVLRIFTPRANVAWAFSHQHCFLLQNINPSLLAFTKEIWVQNIGRVLAEEVEVVLPARPPHFDIWPQRHYVELPNPDGSLVIKFDHLNRREAVTISIFQTGNAFPDAVNVRWLGGVGRQLPMGPMRIWPRWILRLFATLMLIGVFAVFYFIVRMIWL